MKIFRAALPALLLSAPVQGGAAPAPAYHCTILLSEKLDGEAQFMPSVMGDFTLDGKGGYSHVQGDGKVALDKGLLRFTSGAMMGTVGVLRKDAAGREYLHVDKSINGRPESAPRAFDLVCYGK